MKNIWREIARQVLAVILALLFLSQSIMSLCAENAERNANGRANDKNGNNKNVNETINENELYAKAAVLLEGENNRVLYGKNEDKVMPMASTTKIMTLILALELGELDSVVTVSKRAASMPDVQLNAQTNEQFYLRDLLYSLMLESHNDSAVAIAEHIGGSVEGFATLMNEKAKEIGCKNTHYITPNGLDGNDEGGIHGTTATELAMIMSYCLYTSNHAEQFLKITQTKNYQFQSLGKKDGEKTTGSKRNFSCNNHNRFLEMMDGAISGKTGFTGNAGYCFVGAYEKDGRKLISVVLGCGWPPHKTWKWADTKKLMEYGIRTFTVYELDQVIIDEASLPKIEIENAIRDNFDLPYYMEVTKGNEVKKGMKVLLKEGEKVDVKIQIEQKKEAPIEKSEEVGKIIYSINGKTYKEETIITKKCVKKVNFSFCIKKIVDRYFHSLFL